MIVLYRLGCILLIVAILLLVHEGYNAFAEGGYRFIPLGEIWFRLDRMLGTGTLNITQAFTQRYLWPWIWEQGFQPLLVLPAWVGPGLAGLVLMAIGSRGRKRRYRS